MGGLSRKISLLDKYQSSTTRSIVVDSGNILFPSPRLLTGKASGQKRVAEIIAQAYIAGREAVVSIGHYDLAAGLDFLKELQTKYQLVFLSANLVSSTDRVHIFSPMLIKKVGDLKVAIIGLTDHQAADDGDNQSYAIATWQQTLPAIIDSTGSADLTILLSSYPEHVNLEIAERFDTIDIIVQSGRIGKNSLPTLRNNALICTTAGRGKYQGILQIQREGSGRWMQGQAEKPSETPMENKPAAGSTFRNRFIAIAPNLPEDQETRALIRGGKP